MIKELILHGLASISKQLAETPIDGQPIGKVNFVLRDSKHRIWLTVSTRVNPWTQAASSRVRDGYIAVLDEHGLRVVAEGFHFTNEIRFDANEAWLYIVETTGPHISRMRLDESHPDGVRLTTYDPVFAAQMEVAEQIMRDRRDLLRKLAE